MRMERQVMEPGYMKPQAGSDSTADGLYPRMFWEERKATQRKMAWEKREIVKNGIKGREEFGSLSQGEGGETEQELNLHF